MTANKKFQERQWVFGINKKNTNKEKVVFTFGPKYRGKWSKNDGGSCKTSGWSDEGKRVYVDLVTQVKAARAKNNCKTIEKGMLQLLKDNLGLTANSHAEEVSGNRKKKAKTKKPKENIVNFYVEDSDDDLDDIIGI